MCGICGIINFNNSVVIGNDLKKMMTRMKHRGPDDEGIFIDKNIGLGFVRLSILDLTAAGHQPMKSNDGEHIIIFNGEIFNYLELKKELKNKYEFRTETDTEVILAAYKEWGESCVRKFNGMWAFAIYNVKDRHLFISRDRFGIKPFFYYKSNERFIFASDIPPILEFLGNKPEPDEQSIYDFLVFNRTNYTESTFFKDIKRLQHSHNIIVKQKEFSIYRWYDLQKELKTPFKNEHEFKEALDLSIKQQLRSDVPVGACLSGGLDSSSIVSLITKDEIQHSIETFSAVYGKGQKGDESLFINEYDGIIEKKNFAKPTVESLLSQLDTFVEAMVEPLPGTSEYAEFKVMEKAAGKSTVLLNGQGADEQMGGYLVFFGYYFKELFYKLKWLKLIQEIWFYLKIHKSLIGIKSFFFFVLPVFLKNSLLVNNTKYLSKGFRTKLKASKELTNTLYNSRTLKQSFIDHFEHKFEHHLLWADRSGMWFSIETRFPFLDHRLVERVISLQPDKLMNKGITKKILRDSMKGILPETIRTRIDKVGYETPEDEWLRSKEFQNLIWEIFSSESFKNRGFFDIENIKRAYSMHLQRKANFGKEVWKWVHLELWFRKFID